MPRTAIRPQTLHGAPPKGYRAAEGEDVQKLTVAFGELIRRMRLEREMTQAELAAYAEVDPNFVGMIERAERRITLYNAWRIAGGLGLSLAELVEPLPRRKTRLATGQSRKAHQRQP